MHAAPRILLTSVFKPFAQDDEFGSRAINPVELYHNQVTREQGPFSLRMFHRTWSLMLLQRNISAPCTVLDFPTREHVLRELAAHPYDIVGISGIVVNVGKVAELCRLVRRHSPRSTIVVGGHVTAIPEIAQLVDADHIVRGEGVSWLRGFLGEDIRRPIAHPLIRSSFGFRLMGLPPTSGGRMCFLDRCRAARGPEWQPAGTTAEGDVRRKAHAEHTPLARFVEEWNGAGSADAAYAPLERHLRDFGRRLRARS